ncbi:MAG: response regulator transcription factor [Bacteroidales bacterium]|nr:response regulator transcription factor [Bacteroidales bacterium]
MKVLVTEDDDITRKILHKSIQNAGFDVVTVKDAQEAIKILEKNGIDVVIIDIYMPGIDGIELIRIIRNELKNNLPIAVLSREKSEHMVVKAFEAGADDFVTKPFEATNLIDRINKLVQKHGRPV